MSIKKATAFTACPQKLCLRNTYNVTENALLKKRSWTPEKIMAGSPDALPLMSYKRTTPIAVCHQHLFAGLGVADFLWVLQFTPHSLSPIA